MTPPDTPDYARMAKRLAANTHNLEVKARTYALLNIAEAIDANTEQLRTMTEHVKYLADHAATR